MQLPSTRVLALLRVPQLLLPQVPVRLVRRRRDELAAQLQSKKMQRPGQVTQVPLLQWSTQAHQLMLFGNRRSRLQPLPPLLSPRQWRRAPPRPTQRAAAIPEAPERDALARAFPASLARSGATSGRDPVQDAERKVDQAREAYDAAQADPKASTGMKFHLYGKMQEAVLALSKGCPHNLEQQVVEGALQNPPAEAGICADAIRV